MTAQDIAGLIERLCHEADEAFEAGYGSHEDSLREAASALRALVAENERLFNDCCELKAMAVDSMAAYAVTEKRRADLEAERDVLRQRLEAAETVLDNVQHGVGCPGLWDKPCTCGLDAYRSKQR
jgi:chromosome segregation ATPase